MAKFLSKNGKFYMRDGKLLQYFSTLAAGNTWYKSSQNKDTITKITLKNSYTPETTVDETWDASAAQDGSIMAYRTGTEIIIAGNGSGKIFANSDSQSAFNGFSGMKTFAGADVLDTSKVTNISFMFNK